MSIATIYDQFILSADMTLHDALIAITANKRGTVIIVDDANHVQGVVSDGDIRRALVRGGTQLTPILKVANTNFLSVQQSTSSDFEKIFQDHAEITIIPIVDKNNLLVGVAVRD